MAQALRYDGQTVVATGAGAGRTLCSSHQEEPLSWLTTLDALRNQTALIQRFQKSFASSRLLECRWASLQAADVVVDEIKAAGGRATPDYHSVVEVDRIIETAIDATGRIDVLINNADILRDISFKNMKDANWDSIIETHVPGPYKLTRAAWPH